MTSVRIKGLLGLSHIPVEAPRKRIKEVNRGVGTADRGNRPLRRPNVQCLSLFELNTAATVCRDPGALTALGRVIDVELGRVGQEEGAKREGMRANRGDQDSRHRRMNNGSASGQLRWVRKKKEKRRKKKL